MFNNNKSQWCSGSLQHNTPNQTKHSIKTVSTRLPLISYCCTLSFPVSLAWCVQNPNTHKHTSSVTLGREELTKDDSLHHLLLRLWYYRRQTKTTMRFLGAVLGFPETVIQRHFTAGGFTQFVLEQNSAKAFPHNSRNFPSSSVIKNTNAALTFGYTFAGFRQNHFSVGYWWTKSLARSIKLHNSTEHLSSSGQNNPLPKNRISSRPQIGST